MVFLAVYVTANSEKEAEQIAEHLLKKRLVACANLFPIKSMYWWRGDIEKEDEFALVLKTTEEHRTAIISEIKKIHSYEIPCVEFLAVTDGNPDYLNWIFQETTQH
jgi:periplasmic divalent cation tolerance protein